MSAALSKSIEIWNIIFQNNRALIVSELKFIIAGMQIRKIKLQAFQLRRSERVGQS